MGSKKQSHSIGLSIAIGVLITILTALVCVGVTALLILNEKVDEDAIRIITTVIIFAVIFIGTMSAGKIAGEKYGTVCVGVMLSVLLLMIGTNIIFFDGTFLGFIKSALSMIVGGGVSCVILIKGSGKKRKRR